MRAHLPTLPSDLTRSPSRVELSRTREYLSAGADCVYPIGVTAADEIRVLAEEMGGPVNIWLRPGTPSLEEHTRLGVARISLARGLQRIASVSVQRALEALASGNSEAAVALLA